MYLMQSRHIFLYIFSSWEVQIFDQTAEKLRDVGIYVDVWGFITSNISIVQVMLSITNYNFLYKMLYIELYYPKDSGSMNIHCKI